MHFIFEALKSNGTLTSLSCGGNNMHVINGSLSLLAETLSSRNAIEHLSLKGELGDDGAMLFAKMITNSRLTSRSGCSEMGTEAQSKYFLY